MKINLVELNSKLITLHEEISKEREQEKTKETLEASCKVIDLQDELSSIMAVIRLLNKRTKKPAS